jgi:hypothetical protein
VKNAVSVARAIAALAVLAAAFAASTQAEELSKRCQQRTAFARKNLPLPYLPQDSQTIVYLRVAGVRYAIPANYFRYPPIGCDTEEGGFLLRVLLPTFEGWTKKNRKAIEGFGGMNILANVLPTEGMSRVFCPSARR